MGTSKYALVEGVNQVDDSRAGCRIVGCEKDREMRGLCRGHRAWARRNKVYEQWAAAPKRPPKSSASAKSQPCTSDPGIQLENLPPPPEPKAAEALPEPAGPSPELAAAEALPPATVPTKGRPAITQEADEPSEAAAPEPVTPSRLSVEEVTELVQSLAQQHAAAEGLAQLLQKAHPRIMRVAQELELVGPAQVLLLERLDQAIDEVARELHRVANGEVARG